MLEANDILLIVLAFCALWFTAFVCWLIYQMAMMLKHVNDIVTDVHETLGKMKRAVSGIRGRSNEKGKKLRKLVNAWAFFQLQQFIGYKAAAAGVKVLFVDPRYTSQTCSVCGTIGSRRKHKFSCATCGFVADADVNAARNIAASGVACHSAQKTRATL